MTGDYLVYDPLSYEKDQHDDWLLDIKLLSEDFRADLVSLQMEELLVEPVIGNAQDHEAVLQIPRNKERKAKLKKNRTYSPNTTSCIIDIWCCAGINGGRHRMLPSRVLSAAWKKKVTCAD